MLYKCIRPLLFLLDPDRAHALVLFFISLPPVRCILQIAYGRMSAKHKTTLFGLEFKNRVGLAAGVDKNATALLAWQALGFGFVEVGTVTPRPQAGNKIPRILRFPKESALVNWMGFPNDGVDKVLKRVEKVRTKMTIPIGLNIGKNASTPLDQAVLDYDACIQKGNDIVDFFVINISSPNTPQLRELQNKQYLEALLQKLRGRTKKPILLKLSADLKDVQLEELIQTCEEKNIDGLIVSNTTTDYALLPNFQLGKGGVSGKPLQKKSNELLGNVRAKTNLPVVGVGGILTSHDAKDKFQNGAQLIEIFTGLIYHGPGLIKDLIRD